MMSKKFPENNSLDLAEINREMLREWDEKDIFKRSLEARKGSTPFVFYEGPPSANGMRVYITLLHVQLKIYLQV